MDGCSKHTLTWIACEVAVLTACCCGPVTAQPPSLWNDLDAKRAAFIAQVKLEQERQRAAREAGIQLVVPVGVDIGGRMIGEREVVIDDRQFRTFVFGVPDGAVRVRQQLNDQVAAAVAEIDRHCRLSDEQKRKLRLAGRGDIKNWFDDVEELRTAMTSGPLSPVEHREGLNHLAFLGARQLNLFADDSLFHKTLLRTLSVEQRATFERARRVNAVEALLNSPPKPEGLSRLTTAERRQIAEFIVDRCPTVADAGRHAQFVVWLQAGEMVDDLKPLMNDGQWQVLEAKVAHARIFEESLRNKGAWPVKPPERDAVNDD